MLQDNYQRLEGKSRHEVQEAARKILEDINTIATNERQDHAPERKNTNQRKQERRMKDRRTLERRSSERRAVERRDFEAEHKKWQQEQQNRTVKQKKSEKKKHQSNKKIMWIAVVVGILAILSIVFVWWNTQPKFLHSSISHPLPSQEWVQTTTTPALPTSMDHLTRRKIPTTSKA